MVSTWYQGRVCKWLIRADILAFTVNMKWDFIFEMDICSVSKTGYLTEYEVKISRGDFRNDFKKQQAGLNKHEWLSGKIKGKNYQEKLKPNRFYFVIPKGLVKEYEIPEHCGLIEITSSSFEITKKAPLLHSTKADPKLIFKIARNSCIKLVKFL